VLLEFEKPDFVLGGSALVSLWCAALVFRIHHAYVPTKRGRGESRGQALLAGARAVVGARDVRLLLGLGSA
jgi:hypothetical protein